MRTDPLEVQDRSARGQGPRIQGAKCSKKKGPPKSFPGNLQKKGLRARRRQFSAKSQAFNKKKVFPNFPRFSANFQGKEGHGHGPFLTNQKSAVLEPRSGYFRGLVGFKAKDFIMCPRGRPQGQERPRGLHLWYLIRF